MKHTGMPRNTTSAAVLPPDRVVADGVRCDPRSARPHDATSVPLLADAGRASVLRDASRDWLSWDLTVHQLDDLELLLKGFYGPLRGFMTRAEYHEVTSDRRLNGCPWPLPVLLAVPTALAAKLSPSSMLALRDSEGVMLAVLHVADIWATEEDSAPTQCETRGGPGNGSCYLGGRIEGLLPPAHYDFAQFRLTAPEVRTEIARRGWTSVIGFTPQSLLHRAEVEGALHLMNATGAAMLVHVADGNSADAHHCGGLRCYALALARLPPERVLLILSPPVGDPHDPRARQALALIHQQLGCTHVTTGPSLERAQGDPLDLTSLSEEVGVTVLPFPGFAYDSTRDRYVTVTEPERGSGGVPPLSESTLRRLLEQGEEIPGWFTYPEVATELRRRYRPRREQGLTIFFTGLSGSGKSTIAKALLEVLLERDSRAVTLLDGDLARRHLSSELGFSREHRTLNVRRIGYVASEINKHGGIAICALIAPHAEAREEVRRMIEAAGGFVLVHVATSLEVCEARDRKGLYAKARAGLIPHFTGISDPYEAPTDAHVTIDAGTQSVGAATDAVLGHLQAAGYLST